MLFISFLICSIASIFSSINEEASIWNICEYTDTSRTHFDFGDHYSMIMTICNYVVLFLIPFVFISIIYSVIYTEAHANSERIRRDSNCTLLQGSTLVHHMFKCSVKITDRLGKLNFVQKLLLSINIWLPSRFPIKNVRFISNQWNGGQKSNFLNWTLSSSEYHLYFNSSVFLTFVQWMGGFITSIFIHWWSYNIDHWRKRYLLEIRM